MKIANILLGIIAALLLAGLILEIFRSGTPENQPDGITGAYTLAFYSEDDSEAARRVAARYNQQSRRLVLMPGGEYFLFQGETVEAGRWSLKAGTLTIGKAVYQATLHPGGMVLKGESYLLISAWKQAG